MNKTGIIFTITAAIVAAVFVFAGPIPQPQNYYNFADQKTIFGVPNFWNVLSNLPFLLVGAAGIIADRKNQLVHDNYPGYPVYQMLFWGVGLTCLGSSWFHLNPNNETLVWDRLPMTIGFMAFMVGLLSEYTRREWQKVLMYPMLLAGFASVAYWIVSENMGRGDLRPYVLVQFVPLILLPIIALTRRPKFTRGRDLIGVFFFYFLAKILEFFDREIFEIFNVISGHSLKHLAAAFATYLLLQMLRKRELV